ncbi:MAG: cytochrome [Frankiales bacterium]|nr:cytochrome [Frankiales bacterium]
MTLETGTPTTGTGFPSTDELMRELSEVFAASKVSDIYPGLAQRRRDTPVMEGDLLAEFGAPSMAAGFDGSRAVYTLFRYDDVLAALKDDETFSSSPMQDALGPLLGTVITGLDGEEHRHLRALLSPAVARENFGLWQETIVDPVVTQLVADVAAGDGRADLMGFAVRFPIRIIYEVLGFPTDDLESYELFQARALTTLLGFGSTDPAMADKAMANMMRALESVQGLYDDMLPIVQRRRAEGAVGHDLIAHLLRAEVDGVRMTDHEVTVLARSLLPAAAETTTRSWSNMMVCLLNRPELLDAVRADRSLVPKVVNETMRFEPTSVANARLTTRDVEIRGVTIPAGTGVTLMQGAANRDEEVYADPDTFDPFRTGKPSLTFGWGAHMCIGMNLAKLEMVSALNAVLDGLPGLRADPDAPAPEVAGITLRGARALPVVWG